MQPFSEIKQPAGLVVSIHPAANVGTVTLKVADLRRSLAFFTTVLGRISLQQDTRTAVLGAG